MPDALRFYIATALPEESQKQRLQLPRRNWKSKTSLLQCPFGHNNKVIATRKLFTVQAKKLTQDAFYPVADDCITRLACDSQAKTPWVFILTLTNKNDELLGIKALSSVIAQQEISALPQPVVRHGR